MVYVLAMVALVAGEMLLTMCNLWYTYGLWPRSFGSLVLFGFLSIVFIGVAEVVRKEAGDA